MSEPTRATVLTISTDDLDMTALGQAASAIRDGGLVAFPTETVYGLGCNALDADAVAKVFAAKQRPATDPLIVHVDGLTMVESVIEGAIPAAAHKLAQAFWPGPLTMILPRGQAVPLAVTSGLDSVAVRCPSHPVAAALIRQAGVPVTAPSANRFNHISPTSAEHVLADLGNECDFIIDSGRTDHGLESTVIALDGAEVTILRHGAITVEQIMQVPGITVVDDGTAVDSPTSPGHENRHYSPATPTLAVAAGVVDASVASAASAAGPSVIFAGYQDRQPDLPTNWQFVSLGSLRALDTIAHALYFELRRIDAQKADVIVVELTGQAGLGRAIDDRLTRAAGSVILRTATELAQAVTAPRARTHD